MTINMTWLKYEFSKKKTKKKAGILETTMGF